MTTQEVFIPIQPVINIFRKKLKPNKRSKSMTITKNNDRYTIKYECPKYNINYTGRYDVVLYFINHLNNQGDVDFANIDDCFEAICDMYDKDHNVANFGINGSLIFTSQSATFH